MPRMTTFSGRIDTEEPRPLPPAEKVAEGRGLFAEAREEEEGGS